MLIYKVWLLNKLLKQSKSLSEKLSLKPFTGSAENGSSRRSKQL